MKKAIFLTATAAMMFVGSFGQQTYEQQMQAEVTKLDQAKSIKDYAQLATDFELIAHLQSTQWLPYYYAAFCNAKVGWLKQNDDPDNIDHFADNAEQQIKKAQLLLDTSRQQKELSELYCVFSMLNRARVFINPPTYGPKYGPSASRYTILARQKDPDNPRALYLAGWEKFATPKMWGGDKGKAKELLTEAQQKLDNNPSSGIEPHWGKTEVKDILKQLK
jgi:hypothetical protein